MSNWSTVRHDSDWPEKLDPEVFSLCDALNAAGFVTYTSCSGHGSQRLMVWFEHSTDERIESMARDLLAAIDSNCVYGLRIRKQIYKDEGDYDWSIEVGPYEIYHDTPSKTALDLTAAAADEVAEIIGAWHLSETRGKLSV